MRRVLSKTPLLLLSILLSCGGLKGPAINFSHLNHLYQPIKIQGKPIGIRFILHMQNSGGYFYNFMEDYRINRSHPSSQKSFEWWAADATSELLQGLLVYYETIPDPEVKDFIGRLAEGLVCMQYGDFDHFPYGAHFSYVNTWHPWGNNQMAVLARAGRLLGRPEWTESAHLEAEALIPRLLLEGFKVDHLRQEKGVILSFPQIAYSFRPLVWGLLQLSEATGEEKYATVAGLVASWFAGNNPSQVPMYDPQTGRYLYYRSGKRESFGWNTGSSYRRRAPRSCCSWILKRRTFTSWKIFETNHPLFRL